MWYKYEYMYSAASQPSDPKHRRERGCTASPVQNRKQLGHYAHCVAAAGGWCVARIPLNSFVATFMPADCCLIPLDIVFCVVARGSEALGVTRDLILSARAMSKATRPVSEFSSIIMLRSTLPRLESQLRGRGADHLLVEILIALSFASLYLKHGALLLELGRGLTNCPNSSIPLQSK